MHHASRTAGFIVLGILAITMPCADAFAASAVPEPDGLVFELGLDRCLIADALD
jgi:hypothetical protein